MIQAVTDIINLILLNKGCKAYLNNFTIKMRAPLTQEELNFRANYTDRVNAISNVNALFSDVEDKVARLNILKSLISTLNLGDVVLAEVQHEIEAAEAAAKEAKKAEADAAAARGSNLGSDTGTTEGATVTEEESDIELPPVPMEGMNFTHNGSEPLFEDGVILDEEDNLPSPSEADDSIDFTENK